MFPGLVPELPLHVAFNRAASHVDQADIEVAQLAHPVGFKPGSRSLGPITGDSSWSCTCWSSKASTWSTGLHAPAFFCPRFCVLLLLLGRLPQGDDAGLLERVDLPLELLVDVVERGEEFLLDGEEPFGEGVFTCFGAFEVGVLLLVLFFFVFVVALVVLF